MKKFKIANIKNEIHPQNFEKLRTKSIKFQKKNPKFYKNTEEILKNSKKFQKIEKKWPFVTFARVTFAR